jgi:hypothetical protein
MKLHANASEGMDDGAHGEQNLSETGLDHRNCYTENDVLTVRMANAGTVLPAERYTSPRKSSFQAA